MKSFLRFFFRLLYHQLAFTYDLVAASVSFNRWKNWVLSVLPFVKGERVLEIGHGPGHLQRALLTDRRSSVQDRRLLTVGIDESAQMGRLAQRNLRQAFGSLNNDYTQINLTRGVAQWLPFPAEIFNTIVATFPTEYITDPQTLAEVKRCLTHGGRLVVLPVALPRNRALDWLFKVTHQRPTEALDILQSKLREPFVAAGFATEVRTLDAKSGILLVVLAMKTSP